jgi:phage-related protein
MTFALKFGSYAFPSTFYPSAEPAEAAVALARLPRAEGARASARLLTEKTLRVEGGLLQEATAPLRAKLDAMKAALQGSQALYFEADRYWRNAQLRDFETSYEATGYGRMARVRLAFVTGDPYQYSTTETNTNRVISASGQTLSVTNGGDAPAAPSVELTVGGSGAVTLGATITNSTTGKAFTLAGAVTGGDVIIVNALEKTVTIGGTDKTALFDGLFWELATGANTVTLTYTSGTITNLVVKHRARYY